MTDTTAAHTPAVLTVPNVWAVIDTDPDTAHAVAALTSSRNRFASSLARMAAALIRRMFPTAANVVFGVFTGDEDQTIAHLLLIKDADGGILWFAEPTCWCRRDVTAYRDNGGQLIAIESATQDAIQDQLAEAYDAHDEHFDSFDDCHDLHDYPVVRALHIGQALGEQSAAPADMFTVTWSESSEYTITLPADELAQLVGVDTAELDHEDAAHIVSSSLADRLAELPEATCTNFERDDIDWTRNG